MLVSGTMEYGMARLYELLSGGWNEDIEVAVFDSLIDACIWLTSQSYTAPLSTAKVDA